MDGNPDIPIYLFAKAPVPGAVKTRMQPHLTEFESAQLAETMLIQSVEKIHGFWPGKLVLTVHPDKNHPVFDELIARYQLEIEIQIRGDLGERMQFVIEKSLEEVGCGAVMGCDVPHISGLLLQQIYDRMCAGKNVIGPAQDGGFYFLGMHETKKEMFDQVVWGSSEVLSKTLDNFQQCGLQTELCAELRDIDDWNDLCWLASIEERYQRFIN